MSPAMEFLLWCASGVGLCFSFMLICDTIDIFYTFWNALKAFIRRLGEVFIQIVTLEPMRRKPAPRPEREPDWVAAAEEVGFFDPIPEPLWSELTMWTPAERQAFGMDETTAFIDATDRELRAIEHARLEQEKREAWEKFSRDADEAERQMAAYRAQQNALMTRSIRRNGVQILEGEIGADKPLQAWSGVPR